MELGDKVFKLRKEKGLSQESLAEQLGTTRQAISKWENNQGFPETEKLLLLANVFNVSIDYLLKDQESSLKSEHDGYYVSREKAEAWILHERQMIMKLGIGIAFLICAGIPYLLFKEFDIVRILCVVAFILIGIMNTIKFCISDSDYEFKALKQYSLLFDNKYFEELKSRYAGVKKKYLNMMMLLPIVLVLTGSMIVVEKYSHVAMWDLMIPIFLFLIALSIFSFLYGSTMKETYELLIQNDEYNSKMTTRLMKKFRNKLKDHEHSEGT